MSTDKPKPQTPIRTGMTTPRDTRTPDEIREAEAKERKRRRGGNRNWWKKEQPPKGD